MLFRSDGHNLYVAFVAYDTDPSKIRAALRDRDTLWQDDTQQLMMILVVQVSLLLHRSSYEIR